MTGFDGAAQPDPLSIITDTIEGVRVVVPRGEIDFGNRDHLARTLLAPGGTAPPRTVLDLSDVTFMDSSGINLLVVAHRTAVDAKGWLRLAGLHGTVLRVVRMAGIDAAIPCYTTLRYALHA
ncbi:STAS domain-containing protein [Streptomyces minutiscleroticus]|uniref:Anti-sigma factor antagonist n=1 Tax=Streptomyces minutiscleroticus TaxID=68238 RepID=A0A918KCT5_9ACTN|nr:STAS domain-containing protein [Streptomyces minutiscleroticus]GGX58888.1 hypothetical protein GCM10010358_11300 [Streptomyces minutiscleroticus]